MYKRQERIREAVERNVVSVAGFEGSVTVSLGVAGVHSSVSSRMDLMKAADQAVYQAKNKGRNRIEASGAPDPTPEEREKPRRSA